MKLSRLRSCPPQVCCKSIIRRLLAFAVSEELLFPIIVLPENISDKPTTSEQQQFVRTSLLLVYDSSMSIMSDDDGTSRQLSSHSSDTCFTHKSSTTSMSNDYYRLQCIDLGFGQGHS